MPVNVTPTPTTPPTVSTSGDSKLVTARELYAVSHRLDDAVNILNDCVAVFSDRSSSETKHSDHIKHINTLVIPLLRLSAVTVLKSAKYVSPIPSVKTVCDRLEKKSAAEIVKPNKQKSVSVQLLEHFMTPIAPRLYERCTKRRRITRSQASADEEIDVPDPSNGNLYTRLEILENLEKIDEHSGLRKKAIAKMMELGYCPYKASSGIYKALRKRKEGTDRLDDEWSTSRGGRPSILNEDDINEIAEVIKKWRGRSVGKEEINYLLGWIMTSYWSMQSLKILTNYGRQNWQNSSLHLTLR
jgi:transposase